MSYKARLLVIDDERTNRAILKRAFHDCDVIEAANSQEALLRLSDSRIDVVLLDIMMPGMNGLDLLQMIRRTTSFSELPIILISALDASEIIANGILAGANDYITKPIDIDVVRARVHTQIKLRRYADERQLIINRLQSANNTKERLMMMASHDLKNPLQNLRLTQSMIRTAYQKERDIRPYIETAEASIKNMQTIIQELLDMNIITGQRVRLAPVNIDTAFNQVIRQYTAIAEQKGIMLQMIPSKAQVEADEYRLVQILNNMVSNAIKYSPPNTVTTLYAELRGEHYWISVRDQGPGIPAHELDALFEPFQRGSNHPTAGETSSGLGLWIVREMADQQKGEVGVECPSDGGSIFWVRLPAVMAAAGV
jgi:two-component system, sensor histidine kinase and response regulator